MTTRRGWHLPTLRGWHWYDVGCVALFWGGFALIAFGVLMMWLGCPNGANCPTAP